MNNTSRMCFVGVKACYGYLVKVLIGEIKGKELKLSQL